MSVHCNIQYEYTDTFGGDANYSWCKRGKIECKDKPFSDLAAVRRVKSALGLSGVKCRRETWGEIIALRPVNSCTIVFIDFHYFGSAS